MEAITGFTQATTPAQPLPASRRTADVVLARSARASSAEPVAQRRAVEPLFRRPRLEGAVQGQAQASQAGAARAGEQPARPAAKPAAKAPPFEWLELEIIPLGQKPDPRGYAVYAQKPQPQPAPVILIETA